MLPHPGLPCDLGALQKELRVRDDRLTSLVQSLLVLSDQVLALIKGMYAPKKSMAAAVSGCAASRHDSRVTQCTCGPLFIAALGCLYL